MGAVARAEVLLHLQDARRDPNPEVRQAARAALARLGERQALQWFRQALASENRQRVHESDPDDRRRGADAALAGPRPPGRRRGRRRWPTCAARRWSRCRRSWSTAWELSEPAL